MSRSGRKLWLPVAILAFGAAGVALLLALRPEMTRRPPQEIVPLVRVVVAEPREHTYGVHAQGTVQPRTESDLVPQVSGEVVWVSPRLVSGGFFTKDEPLVRIDRSDTLVELQSTRAAVARAESEFERAETELRRQRKLREQGVTSQARIDDAENANRVAEAQLQEARARLARAERDLSRTELRAPFEGRVRSEQVDVGQFVERGRAIATLYAVDWAEVPLPIPDRELRYVDVPLAMAPGGGAAADDEPFGPEVLLRAEFAGGEHTWNGRIVRTEGEIDPKTRMVHVVARVEDPYGLHDSSDRPPLAVGLFVEAEIRGRTVEAVYVLPREALREADAMDPRAGHVVHVVGSDGRLAIRPVELLRAERQQVVIGDGLAPGERVSVSPLQAAVDGMRVRVAGQEPEADAKSRAAAAGGAS